MSTRYGVVGVMSTALALAAVLWLPRGRSTSLAELGPEIPFRLEYDRVIIPTSVNGSRPLDLILDTGMGFDGVYLFRADLAGAIDMSGAIDVRVPGAGTGEASTARMIQAGSLALGGVTLDSQRVIISQSDYTQSFRSDGVIGWSLFGHHTVEIDYDREIITLHDTSYVPRDTGWTVLPATVREGLPFFRATVEVTEGDTVPVTLYIDLAAGDAIVMLVRNNQLYAMPDSLDASYLGTGLSGDIHGWKGMSRHLWIGGHVLSRVPTAFAPAEIRSPKKGADGVLGNGLMLRFNTIYDYTHGRLYLRPDRHFQAPFH